MNGFQSRCFLAAAVALSALIPIGAAAALPAVSYDQTATETGFFPFVSLPTDSHFSEATDPSPANNQ